MSRHVTGLPPEVRKQLLHVCLERLLVTGSALSLNLCSPGQSSAEILHQWDVLQKFARVVRPILTAISHAMPEMYMIA